MTVKEGQEESVMPGEEGLITVSGIENGVKGP